MKGLKKQRRIQMLLMSGLLLLAAALLVGVSLRDGIAYFRSPQDVLDNPPVAGEVFRLGGLVIPNGIAFAPDGTTLITITDTAATMTIRFAGVLPDLVGENQGVIALGTLVDDGFVATEVLAKHDETYLPREVAESLKERGIYQRGE